VIDFHHVALEYPGEATLALDDINLHIKKGEFVYLIGHSGAGKTSLMHLLIRRQRPSKGQIYVLNEPLSRYRGARVALHRRRIGMVFQDNLLLEHLSAWQNVAFALRVAGLPKRQWSDRVGEVLELVGLEHRASHLPRQLSQGEQQRVAIARAIVARPPLLLCDEPTGNLDPDTTDQVIRLLHEINLQGTTILLATHAHEVVEHFRRRTLTLRKGRLIRDDPYGGYAL
jgi:cell division transport system ATP-binding protein